MTSTYNRLIQDLRLGREEGEDQVQSFFYDNFGITTSNVGPEQKGWDLEVTGFDGSKVGAGKDTYSPEKMLEKFKKKFGATFEVKRDKTSDTTGNIYWECWSNFRIKNAGCMLECKADTIVFVRKKEFIFLSRAILLSWIFDNLFMRTDLADRWMKTTFKTGKKRMMSAKNNSDVLGILIPVDDVRASPACFHIEFRNA